MSREPTEPTEPTNPADTTDTFLVERYWPRNGVGDLVRSDRAIRRSARTLTASGRTARLLGTTFLPAEETAFGRFEAADAATVEEVHRRARVAIDRVVASVELSSASAPAGPPSSESGIGTHPSDRAKGVTP